MASANSSVSITAAPTPWDINLASNTSQSTNDSIAIGSNATANDSGANWLLNQTVTDISAPWHQQQDDNPLGTSVIIAIVLGSVAFLVIGVIVLVCIIRKRVKKKNRAWVDNLTLSYIADSSIDLTKDQTDEMISLDNDNFLNSLMDANSFSVYSNRNNARQYTYSYF